MEIGESCESKPLLHKRMSEGESLPRDALQPPSLNTCYHIQKDSNRFRRTREVRSSENMHGAARSRHKEEGDVRASVRGRIMFNRSPKDLNACRIRGVERTGERPRG